MKGLFEEYGDFVLVILIAMLILSIFFNNLIDLNKEELTKMLGYKENIDYENDD